MPTTITVDLPEETKALLAQVLEELKRRGGAQAKPAAAKPLAEKSAETKPAEAKPVPKPEAEVQPAPTHKDARAAAVRLIQAGHRDEVKALIATFSTEKLDEIPEDKLPAFIEGLRKIGAGA